MTAAGATANRAVFFSGMTVVLSLLGMLIVPTNIFVSLGAGAILRNEHDVHGLTTAATIWVNSGIGLCAGVGLYLTAAGTTGLTLFVLEVLPHIENRLGRHLKGHNGHPQ